MKIYDLESLAKAALKKALDARDEAKAELAKLKAEILEFKLSRDRDVQRAPLVERRSQILEELQALKDELCEVDRKLMGSNPEKTLKLAYTRALHASGEAKRALIQMQASVEPVFQQAMAVRCGNPVTNPITEWIDPSIPQS